MYHFCNVNRNESWFYFSYENTRMTFCILMVDPCCSLCLEVRVRFWIWKAVPLFKHISLSFTLHSTGYCTLRYSPSRMITNSPVSTYVSSGLLHQISSSCCYVYHLDLQIYFGESQLQTPARSFHNNRGFGQSLIYNKIYIGFCITAVPPLVTLVLLVAEKPL